MLPVRQFVKTIRLRPSVRNVSGNISPLVNLTADNEGIATLTMQRPPVNSLNLDLLQELSKSLDEVDKNGYKGMILTSALPTIFCAGLDINEMYKPDMKRAEVFGTVLQEVWIKLFGSKFITAAAINGHAPAGGCLLSLSCEYRVMVSGKATMGLNETALGIVAASWFMDTMHHTISNRETEIALTSGKMFTVDESLKVGLIDQTAADKAEALEKCKQFIKKFDRIPSFARASTKLNLRETILRRLQENRKKELDIFMENLRDSNIQQALETYLGNLKTRNKSR